MNQISFSVKAVQPYSGNLCTMTHILRSKVHLLDYTNPSNFAGCKVAVTKIVSLLWVLADIDLQKQYKSAPVKSLFALISISLFAP